MATDSKKTSGTTEPEATDVKTKEEDSAAPEEAEAVDDREAAADTTADTTDEDSLDLDDDPADAGSAEARAKAASNTNVLAGAGAMVSAAFGLLSLTGTSLGEMMHSRKELIGQIEASASQGQGGSGADQIEAFYGAPWHTAALLNGAFALIAVLVGGVLLTLHAQRAETHSWVKAAALGGIILGAVGLLVSCGMYFDLFAAQPELPEAPAAPPAG